MAVSNNVFSNYHDLPRQYELGGRKGKVSYCDWPLVARAQSHRYYVPAFVDVLRKGKRQLTEAVE